MSVLFNKQSEYALQAVIYLAKKPPQELVAAKDISSKLNIPYHFISKTLQLLVNKGFLTSMKGPFGGFSLARSAKEITVMDIIEAIDGREFIDTCVMGFPDCGGENPCPAHEMWSKIKEKIQADLLSKSLYDMAAGITKPEYKM
ncbi:MAG: Rrf2 family transcriptional regulator [Bacteroidetes bacterium]|nr:Rrf2 family transcriptional regulator [Bacteroidota bacterium]